jgi:hypothetical protein
MQRSFAKLSMGAASEYFSQEYTTNDNRALLLTVDSNVGDFRQSVEKMKGTVGTALPGKKMGPFTVFNQSPHDPRLNWSDLDWLKGIAGDVPIYLKGVSSIEVGLVTLILNRN